MPMWYCTVSSGKKTVYLGCLCLPTLPTYPVPVLWTNTIVAILPIQQNWLKAWVNTLLSFKFLRDYNGVCFCWEHWNNGQQHLDGTTGAVFSQRQFCEGAALMQHWICNQECAWNVGQCWWVEEEKRRRKKGRCSHLFICPHKCLEQL